MGNGVSSPEEAHVVAASAVNAAMAAGTLAMAKAPVENVITKSNGEVGTLEYRLEVSKEKDGAKVPLSLWHDIALYSKTGLNFVCEIPKYTRKKFEIATDEVNTPIKQDEKKGVLREFKKGDLMFNYGCFPRTWEDPSFVHPDAKVGGDNDPLDVCEIGLRQLPTGSVTSVKVLGILCMIDDGEADWKVIAIDEADPWAVLLNDMEDVDRLLPGLTHSIREWFRTYKIPDGKPPNAFALDEKFLPKSYAMDIVQETHQAWRLLFEKADKTALDEALSLARRSSLVNLH